MGQTAPEVVAGSRPARAPAERAVIVTVALGTTLAPLNSTMIAVALPRVMAEFDAGVAAAGWLVTGYLIAMAALQPVAGKLGDRLDRRWLVLAGLAAFGLASLGAALATSLAVLLACRLLQGVAGAVALPNATALVRGLVPAERRAASFGAIGAAAGLAAAVGPLLGGLAVTAADWCAVFLLNVPLVGVALALGWRAIPRRPAARPALPFDLAGALLLCLVLGLGALLLQGRAEQVTDPALAGAVLAGAALLLGWREARHPDPVVPWRLFGRRAFAAANAAVATSNLAMYVTLLALPLLLAAQDGAGGLQAGVLLTVLSATMALAAPLGGRLADRFGRRRPAVAGLLLLTLGLLPPALAGGAPALPPLVAGLGLAGLGLGLAGASLQTAAVEAAGLAAAGVGAGFFSTSRYLGSIAGSALLAGLLGAGGAGGFAAVFLLVVAAALLSALAGLGLRDHA